MTRPDLAAAELSHLAHVALLAGATHVARPDLSASEAARLAAHWWRDPAARGYAISLARHAVAVEMPADMRRAWLAIGALLAALPVRS